MRIIHCQNIGIFNDIIGRQGGPFHVSFLKKKKKKIQKFKRKGYRFRLIRAKKNLGDLGKKVDFNQ